MASGPVTVTVVVTSGTFTPLAWIVVTPGATEVAGMTIPGAVLPSQMKMPVAWMVAISGLLDRRSTFRPSMGAVAFSRSVSSACFPIPAIVTFWLIQVTVACTWTVTGAGGVKPPPAALITAAPVFTPKICGGVAGAVASAGMMTVVGETLTRVGSLLTRSMVSPPGGAGDDRLNVTLAAWLSPRLVGTDIEIAPG